MGYDCGLLSQLGQRGEIKQGSDMGGEGRDFNKLLQDHSEARSHHETRPLQSLFIADSHMKRSGCFSTNLYVARALFDP